MTTTRKSAQRYALWARGVLVGGLIGAALAAWSLARTAGETNWGFAFVLFVGFGSAGLVPALPLFALARVLDVLADLKGEGHPPPKSDMWDA